MLGDIDFIFAMSGRRFMCFLNLIYLELRDFDVQNCFFIFVVVVGLTKFFEVFDV